MSSSTTQEPFKETLKNCLQQQISELEVLNSIYSNEIVLLDKKALEKIYDFIQIETESIPEDLDFVVNLKLQRIHAEILITLPCLYPNERPLITVRCNQLNRNEETSLNSKLKEYIKENHYGDVFLYSGILWVQNYLEDVHIKPSDIQTDPVTKEVDRDKGAFVRYWIYSHHIYSKVKRAHILNYAKQFSLNGFCLPGRPGIICIEGSKNECDEWWKLIKSMNWKKIGIRREEIFSSDEEKERRFSEFLELSGDLGDLSKYLNEIGLPSILNEILGLSKTV